MKKLSKRMFLGLVAGSFLLAGGAFFSAPHMADAMEGHGHKAEMHRPGKMGEHPPVKMDAKEAAQHIADTFGVNASEVEAKISSGADMNHVGQAAMLAKVSGKSFAEVFAMKTSANQWSDVREKLGVTHAQLKEARYGMQAMHLSMRYGIDKNVALGLLKNGYQRHDILCAYALSLETKQEIQSLLDRKKINNRWSDVATEVGVSPDVLMKYAEKMEGKQHPRPGAPHGAPMMKGESPEDMPEPMGEDKE